MKPATRKPFPLSIARLAKSESSDHGSLHGTVVRAVVGAGAGALVVDLVSRALGLGLFESHLFTLGVSVGTLAMIASRGKRWLRGLFGGGLGAGGGALFAATAQWPPFAAVLLGASAAPVLARGESIPRKVATGLLAGATAYAGLYVGEVLLSWDLFAGMVPGPLGTAAAGAAAGLFFGLAAAPKHLLGRPLDAVEKAYLEALSVHDGELHEILSRALGIHRSVRSDLEARRDDPTVERLGQRQGELMLRILVIVEQCRRIERDLAAAPLFEIEERIGALRRKAEAAGDAHAKHTYLAAVDSLDEQRRALESIGRGRERVVARLHANLALLEKVRFSLVHLRSADTERFGGENSPVTEALEELAREIDATSHAMGEVFGPEGPRALAEGETERAEYGKVVPIHDARE